MIGFISVRILKDKRASRKEILGWLACLMLLRGIASAKVNRILHFANVFYQRSPIVTILSPLLHRIRGTGRNFDMNALMRDRIDGRTGEAAASGHRRRPRMASAASA